MNCALCTVCSVQCAVQCCKFLWSRFQLEGTPKQKSLKTCRRQSSQAPNYLWNIPSALMARCTFLDAIASPRSLPAWFGQWLSSIFRAYLQACFSYLVSSKQTRDAQSHGHFVSVWECVWKSYDISLLYCGLPMSQLAVALMWPDRNVHFIVGELLVHKNPTWAHFTL